MKIITIFGTRPELIRLSLVLKLLDKYTDNITVHTGQNFDYELDKVFFKNLNIRKPNYYLNSVGSFGKQISNSIFKIWKNFKKREARQVTCSWRHKLKFDFNYSKKNENTYLSHRGWNRCLNPNSPEEVNRKIIDHCSDIHMVYSSRSANNLKDEGINQKSIFLLGNPIYEVLKFNKSKINKSTILNKLKLTKDKYFLITLHREENVDNLYKLKKIINFLSKYMWKTKN